jgi:outer membrane protein OmpA-like peptidoglycan-associated protein
MPLVSSALMIVRGRCPTPCPLARGWSRAALWGLGAALAITPRGLGAQVIPLKGGVVLTYATQPVDSTSRFDFERELSVVSVAPDEMHLTDLATNVLKPSNKTVKLHIDRTVSHREATLAREIWLGSQSPDSDQHRGSSWMAASTGVMKQLRANGEATVTIGHTGFEGVATLRRVDPNPVPISVLVNMQRQSISTMHTHVDVSPSGLLSVGQGYVESYDIWFVDDTSTAWIVRETGSRKFGDSTRTGDRLGLQELVRVQWMDPTLALSMSEALTKTCRVPANGIHFATASAELTPSSAPTLKAIADLLAKEPAWVITIEGHTDSVGGAAYNKDLSERRSAAVKAALVTTYGVGAARLSTAGYGLSQPIETNTTLAGRARNRRVELVRKC